MLVDAKSKKPNKKPTRKKVVEKKDPDRKPDYDEKDLPKVLKGPVIPEQVVSENYYVPTLDPGCGQPSEPVVETPQGAPMMLLECPKCHQQAPIVFDLPQGVPVEKLAIQCSGCGEKLPFGKLTNQGKGMFIISK